MIKIACDKPLKKYLCSIFGFFLSFLLLICTLGIFNFKINSISILVTSVTVFATIIFFMLIYYISIRKSKDFIILQNNLFIYDKYNISISFNNIQKIECRTFSIFKNQFIIYKYNREIISFLLYKPVIKSIKENIKLPIEYSKEKLLKRLLKKTKSLFGNVWRHIVESKYQILAILFGLLLSVVSIILYSNYKNHSWLIVLISFVCIIFAIIQAYIFYFKEDKVPKILFSLFCLFLFIIILFVLITIFCVLVIKLDFTLDYLMYAIFLSPSFVIVILIVLLLLYCLQYA